MIKKTLEGDFGTFPIEMPRERADAVVNEVKAWQARLLDALYPIVYKDCIHVKLLDSGAVRIKALYLAIGVNLDGMEEVLGLWMASRAFVKRLKPSPRRRRSSRCIIHTVRHRLNFVS